MGSKELLEKANEVTTTLVGSGSGGILNAKQANRFIDYVVNQSVLVADARLVRMREPTVDIDKIDLGTRKIKKATEATDDHTNSAPTFSKISMTTVKLRLDWELSTESLEDNIEGNSLEDHVAQLMATQTANDLEDLLQHGDSTLAASAAPLLCALDGWRKRIRDNSVEQDAAGENLTRKTFDKALRGLPSKYLQRRNQLRWYTSSSLVQDYLWSLTNTGTAGLLDGTAAAYGSNIADAIVNSGRGGANGGNRLATGMSPFGIPLNEVPLFEENEAGTYSGAAGNHGILDLTFPENRIVGIQRELTFYREFKPKKDTIEFTQFMRVANQIENPAAWVHVRNIKVRA